MKIFGMWWHRARSYTPYISMVATTSNKEHWFRLTRIKYLKKSNVIYGKYYIFREGNSSYFGFCFPSQWSSFRKDFFSWKANYLSKKKNLSLKCKPFFFGTTPWETIGHKFISLDKNGRKTWKCIHICSVHSKNQTIHQWFFIFIAEKFFKVNFTPSKDKTLSFFLSGTFFNIS